jgi:transposase
MLEQKLTIVPVTLHSENKVSNSSTSSTASSNNVCTIKTANVEISFPNGVDEHIIQTVMRELKHDYTSVNNIYIICGKTDMRKGIDGLATLIQDSFELDPYGDSIFLFAGWSKDRYKCLYFDGDGFAMLYKRLDKGKLQWPKDENEVRKLSQQEVRWLLEGLSIQQPKAIQKSPKGVF